MKSKTVLCAVAIAACTKTKTQQPVQHPPARSSPAVARELTPSLAPELTAAADAYLKNCDYRVQVDGDVDLGGGMVDECLWESYDQNCMPGTSGCYESGQRCISSCGVTCESCDDACGDDCGECKGGCGEDGICLAECALARETCHEECVEGKRTCTDEDCFAAENECYDEHNEYVDEICPNCNEIIECDGEASTADDSEKAREACRERFKANPEECFDHCNIHS